MFCLMFMIMLCVITSSSSNWKYIQYTGILHIMVWIL